MSDHERAELEARITRLEVECAHVEKEMETLQEVFDQAVEDHMRQLEEIDNYKTTNTQFVQALQAIMDAKGEGAVEIAKRVLGGP